MFKSKVEISSDKNGFNINIKVSKNNNSIITNSNEIIENRINIFLFGYSPVMFELTDGRCIDISNLSKHFTRFERKDIVSRKKASQILQDIEQAIEEMKKAIIKEYEKRPCYYISSSF